MSTRRVFAETSLHNRSLQAASQAGLVNNLNDGMAWGLLPLIYAAAGLTVAQIGILAATYPAVWGVGQLATGAWSDRVGRKSLIATGMCIQAVAIAVIAIGDSFAIWIIAAAALGVGTAMVYPTLLAAVGDVAHPNWRASAVGVYRFWRDAGFAIGAILSGTIADLINPRAAVWVVAALTLASGIVVAIRMSETHIRARNI
jgi:MFS family permease